VVVPDAAHLANLERRTGHADCSSIWTPPDDHTIPGRTRFSRPDEAVADIAGWRHRAHRWFRQRGHPWPDRRTCFRPGAANLTVVSNNAGNADLGLAALLAAGRVRKIICSFPRQSDSWGVRRFYRRAARTGTRPAGHARRNACAAPGPGSAVSGAPPPWATPLAQGKETRIIDGAEYVLELPLRGDVALLQAPPVGRDGIWCIGVPRVTSTR